MIVAIKNVLVYFVELCSKKCKRFGYLTSYNGTSGASSISNIMNIVSDAFTDSLKYEDRLKGVTKTEHSEGVVSDEHSEEPVTCSIEECYRLQ